MGLFNLFGANKRESRRARAARKKELEGDLATAVDLFLEAELPDEAARVLLLRADAERNTEKRIAYCASAAERAVGPELKRRALGRKALIAFDLLRAQGGAFLRGEMLTVATELEAAGELERAAEAFALAGDADAEVRALTAAGAIERLEERLGESEAAARSERERGANLRKMADLERTAERRAALEIARKWLELHDDERVADAARAIRSRLLHGPVVDLEIEGRRRHVALGDDITVGRGDATLQVASRAISRKHIRVYRSGGEALVEDLDTRNGTTLAGARIAAPIPVGAGLRLELGAEIPCVVRPHPDGLAAGVMVEVAGRVVEAPLGELVAGPWRVRLEAARDEAFVVLRTPDGATRPLLGDLELAASVELSAGDELCAARAGAVVLRALARPTGRDEGSGA